CAHHRCARGYRPTRRRVYRARAEVDAGRTDHGHQRGAPRRGDGHHPGSGPQYHRSGTAGLHRHGGGLDREAPPRCLRAGGAEWRGCRVSGALVERAAVRAPGASTRRPCHRTAQRPTMTRWLVAVLVLINAAAWWQLDGERSSRLAGAKQKPAFQEIAPEGTPRLLLLTEATREPVVAVGAQEDSVQVSDTLEPTVDEDP